ncbi:MAG: hypothetical protein JSV08_03220 [Acidobacteriota bacterium]|nr:MAG: hypothetical protein JSV08_03220 [Acidobacteriota bacterium]
MRSRGEEGVELYWLAESVPFETASYGGLLRDTEDTGRVPEEFREQRNVTKGAAQTLQIVFTVRAAGA